MKKPHGLCRPSRGAQQVERLAANGHWYPDNGKPAVAFSGTDNRDVPYAWRTRCSCLAFDKACPATEASRRTCERFGAANGFDRPRVR